MSGETLTGQKTQWIIAQHGWHSLQTSVCVCFLPCTFPLEFRELSIAVIGIHVASGFNCCPFRGQHHFTSFSPGKLLIALITNFFAACMSTFNPLVGGPYQQYLQPAGGGHTNP
eukprot:TRINITY_DN3660_c0_g1_i3.p1 TRINITY_DN3660_c0_g1~~TRINITY_DN3660_c0_g1_i3.p1  ORF type:complete len:114 (-),score=4.95 TRINITY_DN3660_c0_g1_i3:227-568(-)